MPDQWSVGSKAPIAMCSLCVEKLLVLSCKIINYEASRPKPRLNSKTETRFSWVLYSRDKGIVTCVTIHRSNQTGVSLTYYNNKWASAWLMPIDGLLACTFVTKPCESNCCIHCQLGLLWSAIHLPSVLVENIFINCGFADEAKWTSDKMLPSRSSALQVRRWCIVFGWVFYCYGVGVQ